MIIILLIVAITGWAFRKDIASFIKTSNTDIWSNLYNREFSMGEELDLMGELTKNDVTSYPYTHSIQDETHGTFGLRSSSINLYTLTGEVRILWKIVDYTNSLYILEVIEASTQETEGQEKILYFPTPWVLINNITKKGFTITQSNAQETINIINTTNGDHINIRYFVCGTDELVNCENYQNKLTKERDISKDTYNTTYYTLEDRQSWFASLDNRYGVIIEVSRHQLFPYIIENIEFITQERAQKNLLTSAKSMCVEGNQRLQNIDEETLFQSGDKFIWTLRWTDGQNNAFECIVSFDPSNVRDSLDAKIEASSWEDTESSPTQDTDEEHNTDTSDQDSTQDTDQPTNDITQDTKINSSSDTQFPLRQDKGLEFTTHQGDKIIFPSPNIYFESQNILQWPNHQDCSIQMNIVEYAQQDNIDNPSVSVYFCNGTITTPSNNFRVMRRAQWVILIEAHDSSWIDFANNIRIE